MQPGPGRGRALPASACLSCSGLAAKVRKDAGMDLPVMPPVSPMLALSVPEVPTGDFLYEPKWDHP